MNHIGTTTIETKRLILRRFAAPDSRDMFAKWASDPEVTAFMSWPTHESEETSMSVITNWLDQYDKPDYYHWAITMKAEGFVFGSIGLHFVNSIHRRSEVGYCIGREYWNKGYTTEALSGVLKFCFESAGFNRIEAIHDVDNPNSGRVMLSAGMQYEGLLREFNFNKQGIPSDYKLYAITKSDWFKKHEIL